MEKFTKELCDLMINKNLSLIESLDIMRRKPKGIIKKTAGYLYECMEKGSLFSNALKTCPYITFDCVYITFILMAEKTGNLKSVIQYLNKRSERYRENRNKLISAYIYPAFVVVLSVIVCFFLCSFVGIEHKEDLYKSFGFLVFISVLLFYVLGKMLGINKSYEAFLGADLLIQGGVSISAATLCGALIAGVDTKTGRMFTEAGEKLEFGVDLRNAFNLKGEYEEAFYYADATGKDKEVFGKIADWFNERDERRRSICIQLIEPVFIAITGTFLLMLIMNFFMPVLNNVNWM